MILKIPVPGCSGPNRNIPVCGRPSESEPTVLCLTWPRQLGGMACKTQDYVSPLKNTPEGDSLGRDTRLKRPRGRSAIEPIIVRGSPY